MGSRRASMPTTGWRRTDGLCSHGEDVKLNARPLCTNLFLLTDSFLSDGGKSSAGARLLSSSAPTHHALQAPPSQPFFLPEQIQLRRPPVHQTLPRCWFLGRYIDRMVGQRRDEEMAIPCHGLHARAGLHPGHIPGLASCHEENYNENLLVGGRGPAARGDRVVWVGRVAQEVAGLRH